MTSTDAAPMRVVTTAGHVDHGKSSLLRALTGMEPDRYEEERRRGLTLDLGFVWTALPSGAGVAFVDVPGHARLIRTMLAGVGTADLCLFVVAANEGWMPQTEEHLRILELVGARDGVIALTKVDTVDADTRALARLELDERRAGTFLDARPVIDVSATTGEGLDALRAALDELVRRAPAAAQAGRPRLWIDRSFSIKGAGTVVTGTLTGGSLHAPDELDALDVRGRHHPVRVRGLQSQERPRTTVGPGERVAVNLTGVHHRTLGRGAVLVRLPQWRPTARFDASVTTVPGGPGLANRGAHLAYVGTSEQSVRVRLLEGRGALGPGETATARLWLAHPLPLQPGDRFVLRDSGRDATVAGGVVLDVAPVLPVSRARPDASVARVVAERGWVEVDELEALTGVAITPTVGTWVVAPDALAAARTELEQLVTAAGGRGVDLARLDGHLRALVATMPEYVVERGAVRTAGSTDDPVTTAHPWLAALDTHPFSPPDPADVDRAVVRDLVRRGLVVEEQGCFFSLDAVEQARRRVQELLAEHPDGVTIAQLRDALGTTRKYALALASVLDRRGVTIRAGDTRVAGRRLDQPITAHPT